MPAPVTNSPSGAPAPIDNSPANIDALITRSPAALRKSGIFYTPLGRFMAREVRYVVKRKDRLFRKLRKSVPGIEDEVQVALRKSAQDVATQAKAWAPRSHGSMPDGGHYADTINAQAVSAMDLRTQQGVTTRATDMTAWGVFAHWIWRWVEFGTVKYSGQGHIFPAYRLYRKRIKSRIGRAMGKAIKRLKAQ